MVAGLEGRVRQSGMGQSVVALHGQDDQAEPCPHLSLSERTADQRRSGNDPQFGDPDLVGDDRVGFDLFVLDLEPAAAAEVVEAIEPALDDHTVPTTKNESRIRRGPGPAVAHDGNHVQARRRTQPTLGKRHAVEGRVLGYPHHDGPLVHGVLRLDVGQVRRRGFLGDVPLREHAATDESDEQDPDQCDRPADRHEVEEPKGIETVRA